MWQILNKSDLELQCPLWQTVNFNIVLNIQKFLNKRRNKNITKVVFSVNQTFPGCRRKLISLETLLKSITALGSVDF